MVGWHRFCRWVGASGVWLILGGSGLGALGLLGVALVSVPAPSDKQGMAVATDIAAPFAVTMPQVAPRVTPAVTVLAAKGSPSPQPAILGHSTAGFPIDSYTFGDGPMRVAFIGGIHGGSEWNTILLAYTAIDYFTKHPEAIPPSVTLHIIPSANPDGQFLATGSWARFQPSVVRSVQGARFNGNGVDLNRNWACAWSARAWWGGIRTSGGTAPFSEVESRVLRDFLVQDWQGRGAVRGVVFWHSAMPGVFAGGCAGKYAAAEALAAAYAAAAAYPYGKTFSAYPITGDATNWLATQQIPAIVVELASHTAIEWSQNRAGMLGALTHLTAQSTPATTTIPDQQRDFAP